MPVRPTASVFRARFWRDAHLTRLVCGACRDIIGSQRVLPKTASHLIVNLKLKLASCCLCEGDAPGAIAFCVKAEAMKCSIPASLRSKVRKRNGIVTAVTASTWQCVLPIFLKRARRVF